MRPAERIEPMLDLLRKAWLASPDQRLGQLIGNACRDEPIEDEVGAYRDPFNVEDDEVWANLRRMVEGP